MAILLSATIGAGVAYHSLRTHRDIARKRATLDVIIKSESDEYFQRIYKVFSSERFRSSGLEALFSAETVNEKQTKADVDNFLNHYELVAISIEQNILDEQFYKSWMRSTFINHFNDTKNYIEQTRLKSPKAYIAFQALAEKWEEEG